MSDPNEQALTWLEKAKDGISVAWIGTSNIVKRGWTIWVLAIALIGAAGTVMYLNKKNKEAEQQLGQITQELNTVVDANRVTQETLNRVLEEQLRAYQAVTQMNEVIRRDHQQYDSIAKKLDKLADGPVAPVLRETLRDIQSIRNTKKVK
ncbi:MAG: hypothetical protein QXN55_01715 [Candidatus Nitrosotenuis sp.]